MVQIKKQLVSESIINRSSYGYGNPVNSITIHQTGNTNKGADAQAHANLQSKGNSRSASWHYTVDDKQAIQSYPDNVKCWHASDGRGKGNTTSIAIEICINSDGDYKKSIENAAELTKHLMDKHNLDLNDIKQHNDWYPKNCPAQLRAGYKGVTWNDFLNMVEGKKVKKAPKTKVKSVSTKKQNKANLKVDGYWGNETTKALQKALRTPVDGEIWGQYRTSTTKQITSGMKYGPAYTGSKVIKALQKKIGAKADGLLGKETVRELQKYLGTPADGELWKPSRVVKELQRRLNAGTF